MILTIRDFICIMLNTKMMCPKEVIYFLFEYISDKIVNSEDDENAVLDKISPIPDCIHTYFQDSLKITETKNIAFNEYNEQFEKLYNACLNLEEWKRLEYSKKISFKNLEEINRCNIIIKLAEYFDINIF